MLSTVEPWNVICWEGSRHACISCLYSARMTAHFTQHFTAHFTQLFTAHFAQHFTAHFKLFIHTVSLLVHEDQDHWILDCSSFPLTHCFLSQLRLWEVASIYAIHIMQWSSLYCLLTLPATLPSTLQGKGALQKPIISYTYIVNAPTY